MNDRFLFLSIFSFAAGIILYFALPFEPALQFPFLISSLSLACFIKFRRLAFLLILGFSYSALRTDLTGTKILEHSRRNADVRGTIEHVDYSAGGERVYLRTPDDYLYRLSVKGLPCAAGESAAFRANLYAPTAPDAFNNFDYARWSFFSGLSASGTVLAGECAGARDNSPRSRIHFMANNKLSDSLVLGYKNAISKTDNEKIKSAGIAHVFSISGFHLTLVGSWLFFIFYFLTRLFPKFARRYPAKNAALVMTAAGLAGYMFLSGAAVATARSFIMAAAGFLAVMLNRRVLTIRNAAIVFTAMIVAQPFWLVSAGFQLSFAAIFGLFYFFGNAAAPGGRIRNFLYYLVMSSVVATIWTAPFVIYHFGDFPIYGLIGNLVLLPVFSFGIMPVVMFGTLTSALGWTYPFHISDFLYGMAIDFSEWISSLPFSTVSISDFSGFALFLCFAGMTFLFIRQRKSASFMFAAAIIYSLIQPTPILRATADGEVIGFRKDGRTYFNVNYSERHPFIIPRGNKLRADCKKGFCEYKAENWTAASVQRFRPLYENIDRLCGYDFIISRLPLELPMCPDKVVKGGVMIYHSGEIDKMEPARRWN